MKACKVEVMGIRAAKLLLFTEELSRRESLVRKSCAEKNNKVGDESFNKQSQGVQTSIH